MGVLSFEYLIFLLAVFCIYWLSPEKNKKYILIIASFLFCLSYWKTEAFFVLLYIFAIYIFGKNTNIAKVYFFSIILALIPLIIYKYFPFFILKHINGSCFVGISFVSFRAISYLADIYKTKRSISLVDYLLYMLFFPAYISGPIEGANLFLNSVDEQKTIRWDSFVEAIIIIAYGFAIKLVLADRLIGIINIVYENYEIYTKYCLLAILAYPIYIYCDFAGYSYIAYGVGRLFGYNLTLNFRQPYMSKSIKEFWSRWHISLNNWFKNYLYIPLGGNRKGKLRKYLNILFIFCISGIWHGTGIGFIIWGLLNGVYQIVGDLTIKLREKVYSLLKMEKSKIKDLIKISCCYCLIAITWIFFSQGINGFSVIVSLFDYRRIGIMEFMLDVCGRAGSSKIEVGIITIMVLCVAIIDYIENKGIVLSYKISKQNIVIRYISLLFLIALILTFGKYGSGFDANNFIYFGF